MGFLKEPDIKAWLETELPPSRPTRRARPRLDDRRGHSFLMMRSSLFVSPPVSSLMSGLVFLAATAVRRALNTVMISITSCAGSQFLLETRRLAFVDDDDLDVLDFAAREDQFGAEAHEPVLVRKDEPPYALVHDQFAEPVEAPSCGSSKPEPRSAVTSRRQPWRQKRFQQFLLANHSHGSIRRTYPLRIARPRHSRGAGKQTR
jgi:hypothetical protein